MDWFGYAFTPQAAVDLLAQAVVLGSGVGLTLAIVTLFYGRSRA